MNGGASSLSSPISGFTAIPNPYMIPLLFLQSLLIGAGFGIGYQGERRKLSAMSNEDFNKLDLGLHAFNQFKEILARNDFGKMLDLMHPLTKQLADAFGQFINQLPQNIGNVVNEATGGLNLFASSALVGAPGSGGISSTSSDFDKYLKFLAQTAQPGTDFPGPAQNPPTGSSGPIGPPAPEAPVLDAFYATLSDRQLHTIRDNSATWNRIPKAQQKLIEIQLKITHGKHLSTAQAIAKFTIENTEVNKIASLYEEANQKMQYYAKQTRGSRAWNSAIADAFRAISRYNQYVTSIRKANLQLDSRKSIDQKKLIPK